MIPGASANSFYPRGSARSVFAPSTAASSLLLALAIQSFAASPAVTFNKDIAPLVFGHCSNCHRPGQSGPFPLLTYADVKKRARQISEVTARHYMPPWLPDGPRDEFVGDRRLSDAQISLFRQWFEQGAPEGQANDLPPTPDWTNGWQLGEPDLVVRMPRSYTLPADGRDVYRNFVIPVSLPGPRYVRAVELQPDNLRIVHHAFVKVDPTGEVRKLDGKDGQPGFGGMDLPDKVQTPSGCFLSWQPGKMPSAAPPGFGWTLKPGEDLVLQAHLRPTGKPEQLLARVGLYFTDIPPTNTTMVFVLCSLSIDIPAGTNGYVVEDSLMLPVDVDLLAILPHTHYLGKKLESWAVFPGGTRQELLRIPDWDFNWQGDYRYAHPVHLPAGTLLQMHYVYDNSSENPRNPNQPPKEVRYGPQSSDEMAELWFQAQLKGTNDLERLARASNDHKARLFADYAQFRLERDPHDAKARTELGFIQWTQGDLKAAIGSFQTAITDDPGYDQPHYYLGVIHRIQKNLADAKTEFQTAIKLNPQNSKAFGNLAFVYLDQGNLRAAEENLRRVLVLNPADELARTTLQEILDHKPGRGTSKP